MRLGWVNLDNYVSISTHIEDLERSRWWHRIFADKYVIECYLVIYGKWVKFYPWSLTMHECLEAMKQIQKSTQHVPRMIAVTEYKVLHETKWRIRKRFTKTSIPFEVLGEGP